MEIVPNVVDTDVFKPQTETPRASFVLVGVLGERKRFDLALRAVAEVHHLCGPVRLTVIGDGPQRERSSSWPETSRSTRRRRSPVCSTSTRSSAASSAGFPSSRYERGRDIFGCCGGGALRRCSGRDDPLRGAGALRRRNVGIVVETHRSKVSLQGSIKLSGPVGTAPLSGRTRCGGSVSMPLVTTLIASMARSFCRGDQAPQT